MAEPTSELMYELLKRIQAELFEIRSTNSDIKRELNGMRGVLLAVQTDVHNIYGMLSRHDERLGHIERRLELRELAEAQAAFENHPR